MTRKRDDPADVTSVAGPEQKGDERPRLLPPQEIPRKGHTSPSTHRRKRRRQDRSWRGFSVRLYLKPGSNAHALYALLRLAAERYGLAIGDVTEIHDVKSTVKKKTDPLA